MMIVRYVVYVYVAVGGLLPLLAAVLRAKTSFSLKLGLRPASLLNGVEELEQKAAGFVDYIDE